MVGLGLASLLGIGLVRVRACRPDSSGNLLTRRKMEFARVRDRDRVSGRVRACHLDSSGNLLTGVKWSSPYFNIKFCLSVTVCWLYNCGLGIGLVLVELLQSSFVDLVK